MREGEKMMGGLKEGKRGKDSHIWRSGLSPAEKKGTSEGKEKEAEREKKS